MLEPILEYLPYSLRKRFIRAGFFAGMGGRGEAFLRSGFSSIQLSECTRIIDITLHP